MIGWELALRSSTSLGTEAAGCTFSSSSLGVDNVASAQQFGDTTPLQALVLFIQRGNSEKPC